ncbi:hypothetical protein B9G55_19195 [Saccharibacillus sp. O16]|nr:hypothetical protein B9G55_19195 [Saccharibacillus sp. O16]
MNTKVLPRRRPEEAGVDPQGIVDFLDAVGREKFDLRSFMLLRRGEVVAEGWWAPHAPEDRHAMYSVSKSFTSTAVGIAISEGLLKVEDRVVDLLPHLLPDEPHPNLLKMTVHNLLTMGTGHKIDPLEKARTQPNADWAKIFLAAEVENVPGSVFAYSSGATYMLSVILQTLTGQKVVDYLEPRLFAPLGIERKSWQVSPQGYTTGGWGLKLTSEDLAKFGQLYLQKGLWNGDRLVPENWVELASSKRIENGDNQGGDWSRGYGYQFWVCRHGAYRADGAYGQFCVILPEQEAVVVLTSAISRTQELLEEVWAHLLPAMKETPLAPSAIGEEAAKRLQALEHAPLPAGAAPADESWSGRKYRLDGELAVGLKLTTGRFTAQEDGTVFLELEGRADETPQGAANFAIALRCGAGVWQRNEPSAMAGEGVFSPDNGPIYASVSRQEDGSLTFATRSVEEPDLLNLTATFNGDQLELVEHGSVELHLKESRISGQAE